MNTPRNDRLHWTVAIVAVLALHGAALWAVQLDLARQAADAARTPVVAVIEMVVSRVVPATAPAVAPLPSPPLPARPAKAVPPSKLVSKPVAPAVLPRPWPVPVQPSPSPVRPVQTSPLAPEPAAQAAPEPTVAAQPASAASGNVAQADGATRGSAASAGELDLPAQAQGRVTPPSADAAYLRNPKPDYPQVSFLRHETGTVMVRVLIGVDGRAQAAQVVQSSGYARLDDAALTTARDVWRYRPGTRAGVPEAMWYDVPIKFVLE